MSKNKKTNDTRHPLKKEKPRLTPLYISVQSGLKREIENLKLENSYDHLYEATEDVIRRGLK